MTPRPSRVAIVGVGPKGLFSLERLAIEVYSGRLPGPLELHLYEPHPFPGAGPVYDPRQPEFLLMNFANRHIDMWSPPRVILPFERPNLIRWLESHHPGLKHPEGFVPRRIVGEYLHEGFETLLAFLQERLSVVVHPTRVLEVSRPSHRWQVVAEDGSLEIDEVLLTTGHDSRRGERLELGEHPDVVPAVYPVSEHLGPSRVPDRSLVGIRGLGLTAIDAILALTEGRGGVFQPDSQLSCWTYRPSGRECRLRPYSRTGRPMVPKPTWPDPPELESVWMSARWQVQTLRRRPNAEATIGPLLTVLAGTSVRALEVAREYHLESGRSTRAGVERLPSLEELRRVLRRMAGQRIGAPVADSGDPIDAMTRSLEVATGERSPDIDWGLGASWRCLYPEIVELVACRAFQNDSWPPFSRLCREMERIAFGPPATSSAKLLALARAGLLDLQPSASPTVVSDSDSLQLESEGRSYPIDRLVNAVLAPPGGAPRPSPVLAHLLFAGHVRVMPWNSGIEVTPDAQCVGLDGSPSPGLSMIGRPTEGCVLGNDSLNRQLNPAPKRWAHRLARELAASRRSSLGATA